MKKYLLLLAAVLMLTLTTSCNTQQRAINQMRTLTYEIEAHGDTYQPEDWQLAYDDYKRINEKIDNRKLTSEQRAEVGELKGRCLSKFAKCSVGNIVRVVKGAISEGAGIIKGIIDGLTE